MLVPEFQCVIERKRLRTSVPVHSLRFDKCELIMREVSDDERQELLKLRRAGRIQELSRRIREIISHKAVNEEIVFHEGPDKIEYPRHPEAQATFRQKLKAGIIRPEKRLKPADKLSDIILREIGFKVNCSSCTSELARLNRISSSQALIEIEELADKLLKLINQPVEKSRVKAWICEAVQ